MTAERKEQLLQLRKSGYGYRLIAKQTGLSVGTVSSFFTRLEKKKEDEVNTCRYCGKPLNQTKGHRQKVFCDDKCRYLWNKRNPQPSNSAFRKYMCLSCGKEFVVYGGRKQKYCSRECYLYEHCK